MIYCKTTDQSLPAVSILKKIDLKMVRKWGLLKCLNYLQIVGLYILRHSLFSLLFWVLFWRVVIMYSSNSPLSKFRNTRGSIVHAIMHSWLMIVRWVQGGDGIKHCNHVNLMNHFDEITMGGLSSSSTSCFFLSFFLSFSLFYYINSNQYLSLYITIGIYEL